MSILNDVINALFNIDVVGIYNQSTGEQIFTGANMMKAAVDRSAELFKHPLENSREVTDFFVINQDQVRLQIIVANSEYREVYAEITEAFVRGDILDVKLKVGFFSNLIIKGLPHEEDPEKLDAISLELDLEEVQIAALQTVVLEQDDVENPVQSSTIERGVQNPQAPRGSVAIQIGDQITDFARGLIGG